MATREQYYAAFARVRAGTASSEDHRLTNNAAQQAGQMGRDARAAQAAAGSNR